MSSSDAMEVEEELRLPFSRRPEWSDVSPIFVDDGNCVVAVQYTPEHKDALSYFRAVLNSGEKSQRVLELTKDMIGFNQADYTAWQWRWLCVEAVNSDLAVEYQLTQEVMKDNAKNYQLWNHRRKCALRAGPSAAQDELDFSMLALDIDEKNYHAWQHRLAIVDAFSLWEQELQFVEHMIKRDVRNNSAWNQRACVIKRLVKAGVLPAASVSASAEPATGTEATRGGQAHGLLQQVLRQELAYTEHQLLKAPRNESAWNYLAGLFTLPGCHPLEMARWPKVHTICTAVLTANQSCPPALAVLADFYFTAAKAALQHVVALKAAPSADPEQLAAGMAAVRAAARSASTLLDGLTFADPIRTMYWIHRHQVLQKVLDAAGEDGAAGAAGDDDMVA